MIVPVVAAISIALDHASVCALHSLGRAGRKKSCTKWIRKRTSSWHMVSRGDAPIAIGNVLIVAAAASAQLKTDCEIVINLTKALEIGVRVPYLISAAMLE